jgi:hypothetical protein
MFSECNQQGIDKNELEIKKGEQVMNCIIIIRID